MLLFSAQFLCNLTFTDKLARDFNILNVTSETVFLGFLCDIEAGDLPRFVDKYTVELENPKPRMEKSL